ncbi:hypothetical protein [Carboxydothermus ferrireducens]|nr:hypothetical protein [Carboxydothermus ferrireducens]
MVSKIIKKSYLLTAEGGNGKKRKKKVKGDENELSGCIKAYGFGRGNND